MTDRDREQHLQWCKDRALECLVRGDLQQAVVSMGSDLRKHPETCDYNAALMAIGLSLIISNDHDGARRWIEGFR